MKKYVVIICLLLLVGCQAKEKALYVDGEYIGVGEGKCGTIQVKVTITEGIIATIDIIKENETASYISEVKEKLIPQIIENNKLDGIDTLTGATDSANGVLEGVEQALFDALAQEKKVGGNNE